jgi:hypothetical protein
MTHPVVFLIDVDNTLLDNDRVHEDLERQLWSSRSGQTKGTRCSATRTSAPRHGR